MAVKPSLTLAGAFIALLATFVWSGNFIVSRAMAGSVPPVTLACLRWSVAVCILAPFCLRGLIREWPAITAHKRYYFLVSLTGVTVFNTLIYMAGSSTTALNMALIATTSPIFTILMARIFLGEALSGARVAGIILAVAGVVLLAVRGDLSALSDLRFHAGDLLTLGGAAVFAVYTIQLRYKPSGVSPTVFLFAMFLFGLIPLLPLMAWELAAHADPIPLTWVTAVSALYLGLGASISGFWLWNRAVLTIGPGNAALIYYTMPFFSGTLAVLLLGEPVRWFHWAAGGAIICGILIATRLDRG